MKENYAHVTNNFSQTSEFDLFRDVVVIIFNIMSKTHIVEGKRSRNLLFIQIL